LTRVPTQRQICAFVDILGGAQLYLNKHPERAKQFFECVKEFERRLNNWSHHLPHRRRSSALVKTFSDNVVVAFPFGSSEKLDDQQLVSLFLTELKHQVHEFTLYAGFPLRGGVSVGQLLFTDRLVYGPALVEAVRLEKEALFPRVVLGDSVLKYIKNSPSSRLAVRDSDGKNFLHYLGEGSSCMLHKSFVHAGLRDNSAHTHERQKYEWLAQYHNFSARAAGRPEFCVDIERPDAFSLN
jgi:class 3 adenylate cyclase